MNRIIKKTKSLLVILIISNVSLWLGCADYLSIKSDQKLTVPSSGADLLALLNDVAEMNYAYAAGLAELGSDNIYIPYDNWASIINEMDRMTYVWDRTPVNLTYWNPGYRKILTSNTVLELINDVDFSTKDEKREVQGIASFFRGYTFFDLTQVYSVAYNESTVTDNLGIPLRLSSDVNVKSTRANLKETYDQIIADLKHACTLLPDNTPLYPTRPNKYAAYGALARVYLSMGKYSEAKHYADSCLNGPSKLLDYNDYPKGKSYPFERFNEEVIMYSQLSSSSTMLSENRARVTPNLFQAYDDSDLRKSLFFKKMADGLYAFTGDYGQNTNGTKFNGITRSEMLLVRSECLAREGSVKEALKDLNELLSYRYDRETFVPITDVFEQKIVLKRVLNERRKELIYRGLRWSDLRRLEEEFVPTIIREWEEEDYKASREELHNFAFLIPTRILEHSGIEQN